MTLAAFLPLVVFAASPLAGQTPQDRSPDPVFAQVPFDQWLTKSDQSHLRWTARISEPQLSHHQRLIVSVDVEVDGRELAKRRGKGQFLVLVQVEDEKGGVWQNHQEMDLDRMEEGMKANNVEFSQLFFALPGDYRVSIAVYATGTAEHSVTKRRLHVSALKNDPLPDAWRDLPAVEFVPRPMPPDTWFLPAIEGRLRLGVETHEPVRVDLVVNLSPSERFAGSSRAQNRNFGVLLPATKLLSQVEWRNATFSISLLDLSRRRVAYRQNGGTGLDWSKAGSAIAEIVPGIIDVQSLEKRQYGAEFFLDEIRRRIGTPGGAIARRTRVIIVLSSAVGFASGQEVHPIEVDNPTGARVFYIRYVPAPQITVGRLPADGPRRAPANGSLRANFGPPLDQLEPLLKPLEPRVFDVATPEQFRKALATMLAEIAKL